MAKALPAHSCGEAAAPKNAWRLSWRLRCVSCLTRHLMFCGSNLLAGFDEDWLRWSGPSWHALHDFLRGARALPKFNVVSMVFEFEVIVGLIGLLHLLWSVSPAALVSQLALVLISDRDICYGHVAHAGGWNSWPTSCVGLCVLLRTRAQGWAACHEDSWG